jgi:hypothetical protein
MIKRITKIVQSMFQLLFIERTTLSDFPIPQCFSPFFLISLLFSFRSGIDGVAMRADDFPSFSDHPFGTPAKLARLLIQIIHPFVTSLTKIFPRCLAWAGPQQQRGERELFRPGAGAKGEDKGRGEE